MEETIYMIKPEAMMHSKSIRALMERRELQIVLRKRLVLPSWALTCFYPDLLGDLLKLTTLAFLAQVEIGLLQGNEAIERFRILAGTETAPAKCEPGSIRGKYGIVQPFRVGGAIYYANAIHRPKNSDEARKDIGIFHKL
jgi:nucleoside diphosphate kinase